MTDIVSPDVRHRMMAGIRSGSTKPEMTVRKWLHARGFRFRLHRKDLPGTPDIVLPRYKIAIFVHGCFWHHHEGCRLVYVPATRTDWWMKKFQKNIERDARTETQMVALGWKVIKVWECQVRNNTFSDFLQGRLIG